jgi:hypothetical protein
MKRAITAVVLTAACVLGAWAGHIDLSCDAPGYGL